MAAPTTPLPTSSVPSYHRHPHLEPQGRHILDAGGVVKSRRKKGLPPQPPLCLARWQHSPSSSLLLLLQLRSE